MDTRRSDGPAHLGGPTATRRLAVAAAAGAAIAAFGFGLGGNATLARERLDSAQEDQDLDQAILQMEAATAEFISGNPGSWKAMCSKAADASLFGGWGGYERGWEQLGPRYDWASARFAGGEVVFEEISRYVTADLACTVHFERMRARLAGGDETVPVELRVTHLYRRENDGWKLLHRHADPLVSIQTPESVVDE